jgi:hypothetical protein
MLIFNARFKRFNQGSCKVEAISFWINSTNNTKTPIIATELAMPAVATVETVDVVIVEIILVSRPPFLCYMIAYIKNCCQLNVIGIFYQPVLILCAGPYDSSAGPIKSHHMWFSVSQYCGTYVLKLELVQFFDLSRGMGVV